MRLLRLPGRSLVLLAWRFDIHRLHTFPVSHPYVAIVPFRVIPNI
jgi:hypothetical protein